MQHHTRRGFTLIELSVVLVIIGLVASAVLVGRDMIHQARLRRSFAQFQGYVSAVQTFRSKYNCLPGDCPHATEVFGANPLCPVIDNSNSFSNPAYLLEDDPGIPTCNGDGDGRLDAKNTAYEQSSFWQQLADAGLVEGVYMSGYVNMAPGIIPGKTCPVAFSNENWCWLATDGASSALLNAAGFDGITLVPGYTGTVLTASSWDPSKTTYPFTPPEAFSYDSKFDDGNPVSGRIQASLQWNVTTPCTTAYQLGGETAKDPANKPAQYLSNDALYKNLPNCSLAHFTGF